MMDKPEGIEQRDWDDACEAMDRAGWYMRSVRVECAKAILQARSQAFEESAKIAETFPAGYGSASPGLISQAIRQHSQKGRDK